jgi:hypothetical protein
MNDGARFERWNADGMQETITAGRHALQRWEKDESADLKALETLAADLDLDLPEPQDDDEIEEGYREMLDEIEPDGVLERLGGYAEVLEEMDPVGYRCGLVNYRDGLTRDDLIETDGGELVNRQELEAFFSELSDALDEAEELDDEDELDDDDDL